MDTKKKSQTIKFLEEIAGRSMTLGGLLESLRLAEEKSQTAFAKNLKISTSHLCDIEKGRKAVSPARAAQFAKALGRSEVQFVRIALQDELTRSGLRMKVSVKAA
jgi:transcriptional regulator with XRE-family HTH domain